jgi:hypothetical protein
MTRSRTRRRAALRAGLVLLAVLGLYVGATPVAHAAPSSSSIAYTDGTAAAGAYFNHRVPGTHGNRAWIDLRDMKCDAQHVYLSYSVHSLDDGHIGGRRIHNHGGCGTSLGHNLTWSDGYFVRYRACVQRDWAQRDVCGPEREERLP